MTSIPPDTSEAAVPDSAWPVLGVHERRVLGVLVEKAKTTPDAYPMSLNALAAGCNQKSNRDPVLNLADGETEEALLAVQKQHLAIKVIGGRVERWRHALYDVWHVSKVELAVLAELLLRGPQTEGELRGRASRMEPIDDLDTLRAVLRGLVERRLVVYLSPEGRRGALLTHGFHEPQELERLRSRQGAEPSDDPGTGTSSPAAAVSSDTISTLESRLDEAHAQIADLRDCVTKLQTVVADLTEQLRKLQIDLGG